jgi:hypothetical protein
VQAIGIALTVALLVLVLVVLDRLNAAVTTDDHEGLCWSCGQRNQHRWGCPNR